MAIDYHLAIDASMTVLECVKLLTRELGLEARFESAREGARPVHWLRNSGLRSMYVMEGDGNPHGLRLCVEVFGFTPAVLIAMRPSWDHDLYERGMTTMMRTVDLVLRSSKGDVGFAYEFERVHLLRRSGKLYVREDFEKHMNAEELAYITLPFERKALRP
jgi:hypothetical protein